MVRTPPSAKAPPRHRNDGFNLVVLAMAITVLNIMLALALPSWSTMIRREKEAELIFRGLQYAEAIRVFELRHSRQPLRITELIEVEPRSIRQLWHNPMTEDGSWLLLPAAGGQPVNPPAATTDSREREVRERLARRGQGGRGQNGRPGTPQAVRVVPPRPGEPLLTPQPSLPFAGVASPEGESSLMTFNGSNEIKEWHFTKDLLKPGPMIPPQTFQRPVHSGFFWKPFPPGVIPPGIGAPGGAGGGTDLNPPRDPAGPN